MQLQAKVDRETLALHLGVLQAVLQAPRVVLSTKTYEQNNTTFYELRIAPAGSLALPFAEATLVAEATPFVIGAFSVDLAFLVGLVESLPATSTTVTFEIESFPDIAAAAPGMGLSGPAASITIRDLAGSRVNIVSQTHVKEA